MTTTATGDVFGVDARSSIRQSSATPQNPATDRVVSIDVFRGMVMFLMLAELMHLDGLGEKFPESGFLAWLSFHTSHVAWEGCSLHDLIRTRLRPFLDRRLSGGQTHLDAVVDLGQWRLVLRLAGIAALDLRRPTPADLGVPVPRDRSQFDFDLRAQLDGCRSVAGNAVSTFRARTVSNARHRVHDDLVRCRRDADPFLWPAVAVSPQSFYQDLVRRGGSPAEAVAIQNG